jgi:hypothetical protein
MFQDVNRCMENFTWSQFSEECFITCVAFIYAHNCTCTYIHAQVHICMHEHDKVVNTYKRTCTKILQIYTYTQALPSRSSAAPTLRRVYLAHLCLQQNVGRSFVWVRRVSRCGLCAGPVLDGNQGVAGLHYTCLLSTWFLPYLSRIFRRVCWSRA